MEWIAVIIISIRTHTLSAHISPNRIWTISPLPLSDPNHSFDYTIILIH